MGDARHLTEKQKKVIAAAAVVFFLAFCAAVGWFIGRPLVRFAREPEQFRTWVESFGAWSGIVYAGTVFLQVLVALIPGEPLELCGGYAFGAVRGTLLCLAGAVAGSVVVFALVRRFGRDLVEIFFSREKLQSLRFLRSSPKRNVLFWVIFTLPGTPKDLLCYFAGLTDMPWKQWLLICSVGRLPAIITSALGGSALGEQNYMTAIVVFGVTFALSAAGMLVYRAIGRRHEKKVN